MKLVRYTAVWCGPCKMFAPIAEKVTTEMNLPMETVDIDETPTPGIMSVPTVRLVADSGEILAEKTGAMNAPVLKKWIESNSPRF